MACCLRTFQRRLLSNSTSIGLAARLWVRWNRIRRPRKAGLKRGDVILSLNGQPVNSANDLRLRISQTAPGTTVKLGVSRDGKMQDFSVTLGELPPDKVAQEGAGKESPGGARRCRSARPDPRYRSATAVACRHERRCGYLSRPVQPGGLRTESRRRHPGSQPQACNERPRV